MIGQLREMSKETYVSPTVIAQIYAQLGEKKPAVPAREATPNDDPKITDPGFESLRSEPRFNTLEARLKANPSCPAF